MPVLAALQKARKPLRTQIILSSTNDLLKAICEIIENVLNGNIRLSTVEIRRLRRYKSVLRSLIKKNTPKRERQELLIQKGGFLPLLLAPALTLASTILGEVVANAIKK